ncbi:MAG: hypothetical protein FJ125_12630 [Deltaproteobacteria bacterium]|nr:hypothetical protein [Deltaproteobacteria bacterium]
MLLDAERALRRDALDVEARLLRLEGRLADGDRQGAAEDLRLLFTLAPGRDEQLPTLQARLVGAEEAR